MSCGAVCMPVTSQNTNTNLSLGPGPFPSKESQWQRGFEDEEGEIAKYEREYKKTFLEDLKLAIVSEVAPKALAPQIAMNSAHLTAYRTIREFIVQYPKSQKPLKTPCWHGFRVCIRICSTCSIPKFWASSYGDWSR